ncbi:MAG: septum formation family protein [Acidimicrobiia bacterium]
MLRLVIAGAIAGGWWLFTSFDDADRADTGEIVGGGDLSVMTMRAGDCFDDPDGEVVYDVQAIPCSEPHDNEVFAIGEFSSDSDVFPGLIALDDSAYEQCTGSRFESYVGVGYLDSELGVFTLTPTEDSWDEGDRGYVCALYRLDLAKLTGTARASEL